MHRGIHSFLHGVKIVHLANQRVIIDAADMGIERPQNNRDAGSHGMHRLLTQIKEFRKDSGGNITIERTRLHLLIAALHGIGCSLGSIAHDSSIKEP